MRSVGVKVATCRSDRHFLCLTETRGYYPCHAQLFWGEIKSCDALLKPPAVHTATVFMLEAEIVVILGNLRYAQKSLFR